MPTRQVTYELSPPGADIAAQKIREAGRLPEPDEVIVLESGFILLDLESPLQDIEGEEVGGTILCG